MASEGATAMDALSPMYQTLADHLSELVLVVDIDGRMLARLGPTPGPLGFEEGDRAGMHVAERVHPDDLTVGLEMLERARRTPELKEKLVVRARHKNGTWRRLEVATLGRAPDPTLQAAIIRVRDVTETSDPEGDDAAAERSRFVSLAEALPVGVLSAEAHGFLVFANDAALVSFGVGFDRLRGRGWLAHVHESDRDSVVAAIAEMRANRRPTQISFAAVHGDKRAELELSVVPLIQGDRYVGWVGTLEDVTARLAAERELAHRATHDALTGLPNRWLLLDRLAQALSQLRRRDGGVAVVFVDLDGLKRHNDLYGHAAGDAVLVDVANRLYADLPPGATAARIGGDEFVVITHAYPYDAAVALGERLRNRLNYVLAYQDRC